MHHIFCEFLIDPIQDLQKPVPYKMDSQIWLLDYCSLNDLNRVTNERTVSYK